ncbi:DMT family transporter [Caldalkalibacillus salinus]|uniref:DMT family transporter n=1 Tax=Caldalkalibacillus salinus TaxID=2803787 RepID=UPI0019229FFB|nr:DMT family transporter [Caldalkalibacillus salinus]
MQATKPADKHTASLTQKRWTIVLLILTITMIWGYAWVLMKSALDYMGPFTFSTLRFGTGALTLLLVMWVLKVGSPPKHIWGRLVVVGLLQTSFVFMLVMYGLKFVDAGKSSVLLYSMPIWSSLLAAIFLKERLTAMKGTGLLLGILGLVSIMGWDIWVQQTATTLIGEGLIVLAALSWAVSNVYYRLKLEGVNKLQVTAYQMLFGTLGILAVTLIMERGEPIHWTAASVYDVLFTGILASALCFSVWFYLLSHIDMVTATLSTLLVPVFGLFFGWLILGEQLTLNILIGATLIIFGIGLATVYRPRT